MAEEREACLFPGQETELAEVLAERKGRRRDVREGKKGRKQRLLSSSPGDSSAHQNQRHSPSPVGPLLRRGGPVCWSEGVGRGLAVTVLF